MSDGTLTERRLAQVPIKLRYNANKKRRSGAFFVHVFFVRQYP
ncbi:hypothetical protein SeJ_A4508 [Salmonella enterica subsp. enterica serovar Javiana str. GA_MM04042433]|nr:hypothetical protein SeJ_A4508 [Salmonella enterica subsp. enterica serovar Javiana str. GA_MM04042433]